MTEHPERSGGDAQQPVQQPCVSCTAASFRKWLFHASPGESIEYHRGLLVWDRAAAAKLEPETRRELATVADMALEAAERGLVLLAQERWGPFDFAYLAVRTTALSISAAAATNTTPMAAIDAAD
jgi:hypothetical protein